MLIWIVSLLLHCTDTLCRHTIPTFIGIARALGRVSPNLSANGYLLSMLFPTTEYGCLQKQSTVCAGAVMKSSQTDSQRRTFNTFRSIVPRTLSMSILSSSSPSPPRTDVKSSSSVSNRHRSPSPVDYGIVSSDNAADVDCASTNPCDHYLCKIGATFPQDGKSSFDGDLHLEFTSEQLEGLLALVSIFS